MKYKRGHFKTLEITKKQLNCIIQIVSKLWEVGQTFMPKFQFIIFFYEIWINQSENHQKNYMWIFFISVIHINNMMHNSSVH